jgi:hypothetical protein
MLPDLLLPPQCARQPSAVVVAVLIAPFTVVTLALVPAMIVCPFLPDRYQRFVLRLLVSLRQWAEVIMTAAYRGTS